MASTSSLHHIAPCICNSEANIAASLVEQFGEMKILTNIENVHKHKVK